MLINRNLFICNSEARVDRNITNSPLFYFIRIIEDPDLKHIEGAATECGAFFFWRVRKNGSVFFQHL